ncbi:unnamed protein product [Durusdinium trenchii]|uniref:Uncharacterized protein n=1 Tax=Durusdinium trenchii TaxID=1381693 RepID=A0ABP0I0W8_9DINO
MAGACCDLLGEHAFYRRALDLQRLYFHKAHWYSLSTHWRDSPLTESCPAHAQHWICCPVPVRGTVQYDAICHRSMVQAWLMDRYIYFDIHTYIYIYIIFIDLMHHLQQNMAVCLAVCFQVEPEGVFSGAAYDWWSRLPVAGEAEAVSEPASPGTGDEPSRCRRAWRRVDEGDTVHPSFLRGVGVTERPPVPKMRQWHFYEGLPQPGGH